MASYCPHCGAPAPDEARFCMKCGKERLPEPTAPPQAPPTPTGAPAAAVPAAPAAPPAPAAAVPAAPAAPPAPAHTPAHTPALPPVPAAPAGPSPVGAFFGRTFRTGWAGSAQAALWPVALLLIGAVALAIPGYGQGDDPVVGFGTRMRIALALLLQSVGGGFELSGREERPGFGGSDGLSLGTGGSDSSGIPGAADSSGLPGASDSSLEGSFALHFAPLTVTVLWVLALYIGVRVQRTRLVTRAGGHEGRTVGLEAAVRTSLLVTAGVLALALFAQPEIEGIELSSSPVLAALGALLLGLAVSAGVLHRPDRSHWVAARPGAQSFLRATGAAVRALAVVLALCSVVAFISLTQIDDLAELTDLDDSDISPLLVALLILPNLAVTALGIGWGAGAEASVSGSSSMYGSAHESRSFGLSELGDVTNDWAIVGALALGLVCALALGVYAARRCVGRGEALLAAGVFFVLVLLLAGFSGIGVDLSGQALGGGPAFGGSGTGGKGGLDLGISVPEVLLFGLLWIAPAALVGPFLLQMAGQRGAGPIAPAVPAAPLYAPPVTGTGTGTAPGGVAEVESTEATPADTDSAPTDSANADADGEVNADSAEATPVDATPVAYAPTQTAQSLPGTPTMTSTPSAPNPPGTPGAPGTPSAPSTPVSPTPAYAYPHPHSQGAVPAYSPQSPGTPHTVQIGQQPAGGASRGRTSVWVATIAVAVVVGGGATAGILLWQNAEDDSSDNAGKDGRPSVSRTDEPSGAPSASPSASSQSPSASTDTGTDTSGDAAVPAGTERVTDPEGFSFAVPEGWSRQSVNPERPGQITYAGSTGREEFLVGVVTDAPYTSYENFKNIEKHTKSAPDKSDYQRISLEKNTFEGQNGAFWEYTYTDASGRTIHARNQSYIAENGTEYAIQLSWREDFWPAGEGAKTHTTALDTWQLTD
ncbi:zinc-ribbon domain-containing protein [Streptomyces sp. NPDC005865]|uniref:zinc-ribbon domain-containing protein n=1 Tax=Streptomyces sp. NPDC005865 TaxID=3155453 RepID=UPI0033EB030E